MEGLDLTFDPASRPNCVCILKNPSIFIIIDPRGLGENSF